MVTRHASSRATRKTDTATTRSKASVKFTFPVLGSRTKADWRDTLPDCVCVSRELKNDDKAQELVGSLPAFNGIAANSPLGAIPCYFPTKILH